jgi:hypothetical protein
VWVFAYYKKFKHNNLMKKKTLSKKITKVIFSDITKINAFSHSFDFLHDEPDVYRLKLKK